MYTYTFHAYFCKNEIPFPAQSITDAVASAEKRFNDTKRPHHSKDICVSVDEAHRRLSMKLVSSIPIEPQNHLRCCQLFSKLLVSEPTVDPFVSSGRLLRQ